MYSYLNIPNSNNLNIQPLNKYWRIPETEEPGGLPSMGSHRVRHNWSDLAAAAAAAAEKQSCSGPTFGVAGTFSLQRRETDCGQGEQTEEQEEQPSQARLILDWSALSWLWWLLMDVVASGLWLVIICTICTADSLHCTAETNITLWSNYPPNICLKSQIYTYFTLEGIFLRFGTVCGFNSF